jgi:hypothetical protein
MGVVKFATSKNVTVKEYNVPLNNIRKLNWAYNKKDT